MAARLDAAIADTELALVRSGHLTPGYASSEGARDLIDDLAVQVGETPPLSAAHCSSTADTEGIQADVEAYNADVSELVASVDALNEYIDAFEAASD